MTFTLAELGQHEQARALGQDALERCQRVLGPNHLATLGSATGLALALAGLGQHEQARALGQDALERCQRVLGPNHLATQRLRQALGCADLSTTAAIELSLDPLWCGPPKTSPQWKISRYANIALASSTRVRQRRRSSSSTCIRTRTTR